MRFEVSGLRFESFANAKRYKTVYAETITNEEFESFANSKRYKTDPEGSKSET